MSGAQPMSEASALAVANALGIVETTQRKRSEKWADFPHASLRFPKSDRLLARISHDPMFAVDYKL